MENLSKINQFIIYNSPYIKTTGKNKQISLKMAVQIIYNESILIYHFNMNGQEVIKLLKRDGWEILRINGSHYRMGKGSLRTTVPVHGKRDLGYGLLAAIEKQSGVKLL